MKILVCGDAHTDKTYLNWMFHKAAQMEAEKIVQLGDLGWDWPGKTQQKMRSWLTAGYNMNGIPFYWIDGNHEFHGTIDHDADDFVEVTEGAFYIPRGFNWTWGTWKFVGIGGAYSIDKESRTPFKTWWPQEMPDHPQRMRAASAGSADILFTHEAPGFHVQNNHHMHDLVYFPAVKELRSDLENLIHLLEPKHAFHGHWHQRYDMKIGDTELHGIAANVAYWPDRVNWNDAYYILEVPE